MIKARTEDVDFRVFFQLNEADRLVGRKFFVKSFFFFYIYIYEDILDNIPHDRDNPKLCESNFCV